jgi:hypothetical protein
MPPEEPVSIEREGKLGMRRGMLRVREGKL